MNAASITHFNRRNGMFVIRFEDRAYSVLELYDSIDIAVGDQILSKINAIGPHVAFHVGQGQSFNVIGQTGECGLNNALRIAGLVM